MPDWGLYNSLRVSPDFQQKRQDRAMEMQMLLHRRQQVEADISKQFQGQMQMQKYFQTLAEQDILAEDVERMRGVEQELRKPIIDGIRKFGGDVRKYLLSGGHAQLTEYRNSLLTSEQMRTALQNKVNYTNWASDTMEGRFILPVMAEGQEMSFEQAYNSFKNGEIDYLPYAGSEERVDIPYEFFAKTPHPEAKPGEARDVSVGDIVNAVTFKGGSAAQARLRAVEYDEFIRDGGNPAKWAKKDMDWRNEYMRLKSKFLKKQAGDRKDMYSRIMKGLGDRIVVDPRTGKQKAITYGGAEYLVSNSPLSRDLTEKFAGEAGLGKKDRWGYYQGQTYFDYIINGENLEGIPTRDYKIRDIYGGMMHYKGGAGDINGLMAKIRMTEDEAEKAGVWNNVWIFPDSETREWDGRARRVEVFDDDDPNKDYNVELDVIIPVPEDETLMAFFNKWSNIEKGKYESEPYTESLYYGRGMVRETLDEYLQNLPEGTDPNEALSNIWR